MRATVDPTIHIKGQRRYFGCGASVFNVAVALSIAVAAVQLSGYAAAKAQPAAVPEIHPGILQGYFGVQCAPKQPCAASHSPPRGSAALALDEDFSRISLNLRGTPRWALATEDADLMFPHAAGTFSCALHAPITEQDTPHLYMLMRRSLADAGLSTYSAKNEYKRARPFTFNKEPTQNTPDDETNLRGDGSYPSGHTAVGWAWALILSEIAPDRADAILARGRAFGQSRVVCNAHWESDVIEGRFVGAAAVARLHADAAFLADLEAGKAELASVRAKGLKPVRDCKAEASAMALDPPNAP